MNEYNRAIRQATRLVRDRADRETVGEVEVGYQQFAPNPRAEGFKAGLRAAADMIAALELDDD